MRSKAHTPALVPNRVICTHLTSMAGGLHRVSAPCAEGVDAIAGPHVYRISRVTKMVRSS
jgi:hypothetical protein